MRKIALVLVVLVALVASFAVGVTMNPHRCKVVNLREIMAAQDEGFSDFVDDDWGERGMACNVEGYQIIAPIFPEKESIGVYRGDKVLFLATPSDLAIFYDKNLSSCRIGHFPMTEPRDYYDYLSYDTHDEDTGESTMVHDYGIDGQLDDRWIRAEGEKTRRQVFVDGGWHERLSQDGKGGVIINGRFRPIKRNDTGSYVFAAESTP